MILNAGALLMLATLSSSPASADDERDSRAVDASAVVYHKSAAARLSKLVEAKKNTTQEPQLLMHLAETLHKAAGIEFRVAHGRAMGAPSPAMKAEQERLVKATLAPLDRMIQAYPNHRQTPHAYYMRAVVNQEMGRPDASIRDLKYICARYRGAAAFEDRATSHLLLYDLQIQAKDYKGAVEYLRILNARPEDSYYSIVIDRLSWAHYYGGELPEALRQVGILTQFLMSRPGDITKKTELEKAFMNGVLFYSAGMGPTKKEHYRIEDSLNYFQRMNSGPFLGKMAIYLGYLMRAEGLDREIEILKQLAMTAPISELEKRDVILISLENESNRHRYDRVAVVTSELARWFDRNRGIVKLDATWTKAIRQLTDLTTSLQQAWTVSKGHPNGEHVARALQGAYGLMLRVSFTPQQQLEIRYNMAELAMSRKDWEVAAQQYRWVATKGKIVKADSKWVVASEPKSISARYETLTAANTFPRQLTARPLAGVEQKPIPPMVKEWLDWLEEYREGAGAKTPEQWEAYALEGYRLLYSLGYVSDATAGLANLGRKNPRSPRASTAFALVLDTYVASEKWDETNRLANEFLRIGDPAQTQFRERLFTTAADSYYKLVEAAHRAKDYSETMKRAEAFMKMYPQSPRKTDCMALAADAALAGQDRKLAMTFFAPLIDQKNAPGGIRARAILTRATLSEEQYVFTSAMQDYMTFLSLPPADQKGVAEIEPLRKKTLALAWMSGRPDLVKQAIANRGVCPARGQGECARYEALATLMPGAEPMPQDLIERADKGSGAAALVWTVAALNSKRASSLDRRLGLLTQAAALWKNADPYSQFALLPSFAASAADTLRECRRDLARISKLQLDKKSINSRTKLIDKLEGSAEKLTAFPSVRVQVSAVREIGEAYADFSRDLAALPPPPGISAEEKAAYKSTLEELKAPFDAKAAELRTKAAEIAAKSPDPGSILLSPKLLGAYGPQQNWYAHWLQAVERGNWPKVAFLLDDAASHSVLSGKGQLEAAKALSLMAAGARSEALPSLRSAADDAPDAAKASMLMPVVSALYASGDVEATKKAVEQLDEAMTEADWASDTFKSVASRITEATDWSEASVSSKFKERVRPFAPPRAPASKTQPQQQPSSEESK